MAAEERRGAAVERARYLRRRAEGICVSCGKRKTQDGRARCEQCLALRRERAQHKREKRQEKTRRMEEAAVERSFYAVIYDPSVVAVCTHCRYPECRYPLSGCAEFVEAMRAARRARRERRTANENA